MKRLFGWIIKLLALMSFMALLGTVSLWIDSHISPSGIINRGNDLAHKALFDRGSIILSKRSNELSGILKRTNPVSRWSYFREARWFAGMIEGASNHWQFVGFASGDYYEGGKYAAPMTFLMIPFWFPAVLFLILPAHYFIKWRWRRRLGPNSCKKCGYDLTGNETGVCSECGASMTGKKVKPKPDINDET